MAGIQKASTCPLIIGEALEDVSTFANLSKFIMTFKTTEGDTNRENKLIDLHRRLLAGLSESATTYREALLASLTREEADLDGQHMEILEDSITKAKHLLEGDPAEAAMFSRFDKTSHLLLYDLKDLFEDTINRWLKFFLKEFWIMVELGITDFSDMAQYVLSKLLREREELVKPVPFLWTLYKDFIEDVSFHVVRE